MLGSPLYFRLSKNLRKAYVCRAFNFKLMEKFNYLGRMVKRKYRNKKINSEWTVYLISKLHSCNSSYFTLNKMKSEKKNYLTSLSLFFFFFLLNKKYNDSFLIQRFNLLHSRKQF